MKPCKKYALAASFILAALLAGPAQADDTLARLKGGETARLAISNDPPYSAIDNKGDASGAAPEIAIAVLKEMGIQNIEPIVVDYGAMIPGLMAKRFDLIGGGLFVKPERCEAILFSEADVCDAEAFAVKAGSEHELKSFADVAKAGLKIGVCGGCTQEKYALAAGVDPANIVVYPDPASGIKMLQAGRIDVFALAGLSVTDQLKKAADSSLGVVYPVSDAPQSCAAAGFHPDAKEFRDAYDAALAKLKGDGTFEKIVGNYGFSVETALNKKRSDFCPGF